MTINRNHIPEFKTIDHIDILTPERIILDNGIETYILKSQIEDIVKLDLIFNAGSYYQPKKLVARFANEMLLEGTKKISSRTIAEKLDYYGAFLYPSPTLDFATISLLSLNKYLDQTINMMFDIVANANYPSGQFDTFVNNKRQNYLVQMEKGNFVARREFGTQLFGKHPYGQTDVIEDYDAITRDDLLLFHKQYYHSQNCKIILTGNVSEKTIQLLNQTIGSKSWASGVKASTLSKTNVFENPISQKIIDNSKAKQSSIRLGKITINKNHPDFLKLKVVNTILGGFFESRLMKTIREEKGYTYGISSILVPLKEVCYFVILSEVNSEKTKQAVDDILTEVKKLRTTEVKSEELDLVKNYMLGYLLRSFDGIFKTALNFRELIDLNIDFQYYDRMIETIKNINSKDIIDIANKYLHEQSLIKTIVGKY